MEQQIADLDTVIEMRRTAVARRDYKPLGLLTQVNLEPSAGVDHGTLDPKQVQSTMLDWYKKSGTLLGLANQYGDILVIGPLAAPPPIPDPTWKGNGDFNNPPLVEQRLEERASGTLTVKEQTWLVFQPVNQILFKAHMQAAWGLVQCRADRNGKSTVMLYEPKSREAHFIFGQKEIQFR